MLLLLLLLRLMVLNWCVLRRRERCCRRRAERGSAVSLGCSLLPVDLVGNRACDRGVLVAVLVCEAASYCLRGVDALHLFVLSLYVTLVWFMLLLLWLRLADASEYFVLRCAVRNCRRLSLLASGVVLWLLLLLLLLALLLYVLLLLWLL